MSERHCPSRRDFGRIAVFTAIGFGAQSLSAQSADDMQLRSELLMDFDIELDGPGKGSSDIGYLGATMQAVSVTGGWFKGPKVNGRLVPPGGDWLVRPDLPDSVAVACA